MKSLTGWPTNYPEVEALKSELREVGKALMEIKSLGEWAHSIKGDGGCADYVDYGRCAPNSICEVADIAKDVLARPLMREVMGER